MLIPNSSNLTRVVHFQPISLCTVTYKTIAKVLVNKLKLIMNEIIAPIQSVFLTNS